MFKSAFAAALLVKLARANQCSDVGAAVNTLLGPCRNDFFESYCSGRIPDNVTEAPPTTTPKEETKPAQKPTVPTVPGDGVSTAEPFIGSYYPNWMVYNKIYMGLDKIGGSGAATLEPKYTVFPSDLPSLISKLNTLYYSFLDLNKDCYIEEVDKDASWYGVDGSSPTWIQMATHPNACKGAVNDMLSLKSAYPHLRLLASVGGWTFSKHFSNCAKDEANFKRMYDSFSFYTGGDFGKAGSMWAGVDFDWEHPASEGLTADFDAQNDWKNYAKMVAYFRQRAASEGRTEYMQTAALGVGETLDVFEADPSSAVAFCEAIDHINIMTYDMHGKWEPVTGHNAPFCQIDTGSNVRPAVRPVPWSVVDRVELIAKICGAHKIALGLPNYSPAWTDIPAVSNGLYQQSTDSANWARWGTFSDSDSALVSQGIVHWWDLKQTLANPSSGLSVYQKVCPQAEGIEVPVKWVYSASRRIFASYEDEDTVTKKVQWAKKRGLAGFFFWDITQDKEGDLLDAGRQGWGVTVTHPATGTKVCHDSARPDFSKNPDGTQNPYAGCHITSKHVTIPAGEGCGAAKAAADSACGGKGAIAVGGQHATSSECVTACTGSWANGPSLWANDRVYYVCDGETLSDQGSQSGNQGGSQGGNQGNAGACFTPNGWWKASCVVCQQTNSDNTCKDFSSTPCYSTMTECQQNAP